MQAMQAMAGLILVTGDHDPMTELAAQGVNRMEPMAMWQWRVDSTNTLAGTERPECLEFQHTLSCCASSQNCLSRALLFKDMGKPNTFMQLNFLPIANPGQVDTRMVNNEFQPTFKFCVNETVHMPFLQASANAAHGFWIYDEEEKLVPFWVFYADGVSFVKAYKKDNIVIFPGNREGLILQFPKPGLYKAQTTLFRGASVAGLTEQTIAFFQVTDKECTPMDPAIDVDSLVFTPGVEGGDIEEVDIIEEVDVTFNTRFDVGK